jgi:transcriptional regulator GlxA family with amidase domain
MRAKRRIYLLVLPRVHILDLAAPAQIFADAVLEPHVALHYISPVAQVDASQGLHLANLEPLPTDLGADDWVLLIGTRHLARHLHEAEYQQAVQWLARHKDRFGLIAGICSGAILAGKAGILDGKRCTTHHDLIAALNRIAPAALVQKDCIFVADGNIWTSAGITTGLDLCLQLVADHWGQDIALTIAREMVLYQRRSGTEPQLSFWLEHRNHTQSRVHKVQDMVMAAPGDDWKIAQLADRVFLSERHLRRLFIEATGYSIQEYLQRARVELARQLLEQTSLSLEAIAQRRGFAAERSLRRAWRRWMEGTPGGHRKAVR